MRSCAPLCGAGAWRSSRRRPVASTSCSKLVTSRRPRDDLARLDDRSRHRRDHGEAVRPRRPTHRRTAAIEKKLVQRQAAQQAEAKVAQATAEANQKIAAARGEAKSIELEGKALHNNPEVLRLRAINTLNPKAQVIFCNSGDCPSILGGSFTTAPANK